MPMNDVERRVRDIIMREKLFPADKEVLVALSGGADSVALLRILLNLGVACVAAHCNFHLRGEESDRDERFVSDLCSSLDVRLHKIDFDTRSYSKTHHISIEMAARNLRYQFFESLLQKEGYACVAVAHHLNDNVETVLLNLVRGTGIRGLGGMRYRTGSVVRPMLDICRWEIVDYLKTLGQDYVTDSTNLIPDVVRNKIRLQLLPLLKKLNPSIEKTINNVSCHLSNTEEYLQCKIQEDEHLVVKHGEDGMISIDVEKMDKQCHSSFLLFEILHPLGFNPAQIEDIYNSRRSVGKVFQNPRYRLLVDRGVLLVSPFLCPEKSVDIGSEGIFSFNNMRLRVRTMNMSELASIPKESGRVVLNADKLVFPLQWRLVSPGDKFQPFGMRGRKLVSDFMTDCKMSRFDKEKQSAICSQGEIAWLVGRRISQRFSVCVQTDKRVVLLEIL